MKQLNAFIILFLLGYGGFSQNSLSSGWIVLNNGDTLRGKIKEKDWNINPDKIDFTQAIEKTYNVNELSSFGITGGDVYRRYMVTRLLLPNSEDATYPEEDGVTDTVTVWLKIVVEANVSLGVLYQTNRAYFYAIDKNGKATELITSQGIRNFNLDKFKKDIRYGKVLLYEDPVYKNQLYSLFPEKADTYNTNNIQYNEQSLGRLFRKLNDTKDIKSGKQSFYLAISGGVSIFSSNVKGAKSTLYSNLSLLSNSQFETATLPYLRMALNFESGKKRSRVSFIPEIGVSIFNTTGTKTSSAANGKFEIKNIFLETALMTRFILNPSSRQKTFLAGGFNMYFNISAENTYRENGSSGVKEVEVQNFIIAPSVSAGYLFSKLGVSVNYQHLSNITTYVNNSWIVNRFSASLSYFLKK